MDARRRIRAVLVGTAALAAGVAVGTARGDDAGAATYAGLLDTGQAIKFTLSADGKKVTSYVADDIPGDTGCVFHAQGDDGVWPGAAVVDGSFEYRLYSAIIFRGHFDTARTASGTLHLHNDAVPGERPACDTGAVHWTATGPGPASPGTTTSTGTGTTTSTGDGTTTGSTTTGTTSTGTTSTGGGATPAPSSGGSGSGGSGGSGSGGSGGSGSGGSSGSGKGSSSSSGKGSPVRVAATLTLARRGTLLVGRVRARSKSCSARRVVSLRRRSARVAVTTTKADGTFAFKRSPSVRGRKVRVYAAAVVKARVPCAGASSPRTRG